MIQIAKTNRVLSSWLEDLVYVHTTFRLLSREKEEHTNGLVSFTDIGMCIYFLASLIQILYELVLFVCYFVYFKTTYRQR